MCLRTSDVAMDSCSEEQQKSFQQPNEAYRCKVCGLQLNSIDSLNCHSKYHKENLLKTWAAEAASSHPEETNNNTTKTNIKRELISNNTTAVAESADSMQKNSPEYSRTTPDNLFGHPPTPQSFQSANSPYQSHDTSSTFSPNYPNYQIKVERTSPTPQQQQQQQYQNSFINYTEQYFPLDSNQPQQFNQQDTFVHKASPSPYRFNPYPQAQSNPYDRQSQAQVPSSSPAYPPQPTPSPSPKQCDKCGFVCESASTLMEHLNPLSDLSVLCPAIAAPHLYQNNQHFIFDQHPIKQEDTSQSEILDLDSHKVVHNVYPEEEKPQNGEPNQHSMPAMMSLWAAAQPQHPEQHQKIFQEQEQRLFEGGGKMFQASIPETTPENKMFQTEQKLFQPEQKMFQNEQKMFQTEQKMFQAEQKIFQTEQKIFQPHQIQNQEYMRNGVSATSQEVTGNGMSQLSQAYRPFEHMSPPPNAPVITNPQVPSAPVQPPSGGSQKGANWKSNEARRPKTYNCTACNKWFTSSGHLKRHYNTTLHKNAVKSSGQPDPASLPISAHHHPARDNNSKQDDRPQSGSSGDEIRGDDSSMSSQYERLNTMSGLLQQPPNGPYDRQPAPNIHHTPPLHSPMPQSPMPLSPMPQHPSPLGSHLNNLHVSNGSPPNGEAGLSTSNIDSRGLLSLSSTPVSTVNTPHGFNMVSQHMMPMEDIQYPMYPNELAPHVTQAMATNNLNTTGEYQQYSQAESKSLPSFEQFYPSRFGLVGYETANVGGGETVTSSFSFYPMPANTVDLRAGMYGGNGNDMYNLTSMPPPESPQCQDEFIVGYPLSPNNNNVGENMGGGPSLSMIANDDETMDQTKNMIMDDIQRRLEAQPRSPEKAHTKRDYEETTTPLNSSTVVNKVTPPKCEFCQKFFVKTCYLTQHNKTFHTGEKPFKCTRCGKRFGCDVTYKGHLAKHAGDKPHKCDLCPKQFNHKTDLRRHMCLHTGQKPYACDTCGKGFIRKDHMMKHCETHFRKSQSKVASGIR